MDARTGLPVVGMVGAGQLARMTHQAGIPLGQSLRILADSADDGAALVAADVVVGDYRSLEDLRRFARTCDVVTFDHEHVPNEHLRALAADGVNVAPGPDALRFAQDKSTMRARLTELGLASPRWAVVDDLESLAAFGAEVGWPLVLKASSGGYDGKGVWSLDSIEAAGPVVADLQSRGIAVLAEERVADPARAGRPRRPLAVRAGRGVADRRDRPARRHLRRGRRSRFRAGRRAGRSGRGAGPADRVGTRRRRCARGRALRDHRRPAAGQRARHASAQLGPLDDRRVVHVAVRTALAGGARLSARFDHAHRAGDGDGQPARRPGRRGAGRHRRAHAPLHGPLARREGAPVRKGLASRSQGRPRDRPGHRISTKYGRGLERPATT